MPEFAPVSLHNDVCCTPVLKHRKIPVFQMQGLTNLYTMNY